MASEFSVVPKGKAKSIKADTPDTKTGLLRAGEMLFIPGKKYFGAWRSQLAKEGYKFHQRAAEEGGVKGSHIWAEKVK